MGRAVLIRLQRTLCFELVMIRRRCFDTLLVQLEWKMLWRLIICFMDYTQHEWESSKIPGEPSFMLIKAKETKFEVLCYFFFLFSYLSIAALERIA